MLEISIKPRETMALARHVVRFDCPLCHYFGFETLSKSSITREALGHLERDHQVNSVHVKIIFEQPEGTELHEPRVELLTEDEKKAIQMAGDLWNHINQILPNTPQCDTNELIVHIHGIQRAIMSIAAARAYPELFRAFGSYPNG